MPLKNKCDFLLKIFSRTRKKGGRPVKFIDLILQNAKDYVPQRKKKISRVKTLCQLWNTLLRLIHLQFATNKVNTLRNYGEILI